MHKKIPEPDVPVEQPFANDKLDRIESGKVLAHFLSAAITPYVLGIDAGWGQGKTTFLRMWRQHLENGGFPVHYFNAWEADYESDPLVSLMAEVRTFAKTKAAQLPIEEAGAIQRRALAIGKAGIRITKYAVPALVKAGTAGIIDVEGLTDAFKGAGDVAEKLAQRALDEYEEQKKSLATFRKELESLAASLQGERKRPLVVLVDELDRCRPTYAVELIERVKHLFSVPGVVFVLALHRAQLGAAIKSVYGESFDGEGYLRRHFDFEYRLPAPNLREYYVLLYDTLGFDALIAVNRLPKDGRDVILGFGLVCARAFQSSLRDVGRVMSRIFVTFAVGEVNENPSIRMVTILAFLQYGEPELYEGIVNGAVTGEQIWQRFLPTLTNEVALSDATAAEFCAFLLAMVTPPAQLESMARFASEGASFFAGLPPNYRGIVSSVLQGQAKRGAYGGVRAARHAIIRLELAAGFRT
jgi:hypothetical protein